jgi:hypothetical protein
LLSRNLKTGDLKINMFRLRNDGVYELPNGEEVIVGSCYGGAYNLYTREAWNNLDRADYQVISDGQVYYHDGPTGLRVENLLDTGAAAKYWRRSKIL